MADIPSGIRNKANPFFAKENHVKLAKNQENKSEFLTSPIGVKDGGVAVAQHSYYDTDLINTHPDYATISLTTNYESTDENGDPVGIASVVFTEDNVTIAGTSAVTELRYIRLVVTDLAVPANVRTWTIDTSVSPVVSFLSNLQSRSIAIGSPVGRIDFNDGVTGTWTSWVLAPGSDPIPQGRTLTSKGYINNYTAEEDYTGTIIARVTDGAGTSVDVSINLQQAQAAIPFGIDTFTETNGVDLNSYVGESTLPWIDQRGLNNPPTIFDNRLYADPDSVFFSYYHYNTTLIGDAVIKADILYGSNVDITGEVTSVAQIGLAMGSGGVQSGVFFGYSASREQWELRRISVANEQSMVSLPDTSFNIPGQSRELMLIRTGATFDAYLNGVFVLSFTDVLMGSGCGGFRLLGNSPLGGDMSFDNVSWPEDPTLEIYAVIPPTMMPLSADNDPVQALSENALLDENYLSNSGGVPYVESYTRYVNDEPTQAGDESNPVEVGDAVFFVIDVADDVIENRQFVTNAQIATSSTFELEVVNAEIIASSLTQPTSDHTTLSEPWASRGTWPVSVNRNDLGTNVAQFLVPPKLTIPDTGFGKPIFVDPALAAYDGNQAETLITYTLLSGGVAVVGYEDVSLDFINTYVIAGTEQDALMSVQAGLQLQTADSNAILIPEGAPPFAEIGVITDATNWSTAPSTIPDAPKMITFVSMNHPNQAPSTGGRTYAWSFNGDTQLRTANTGGQTTNNQRVAVEQQDGASYGFTTSGSVGREVRMHIIATTELVFTSGTSYFTTLNLSVWTAASGWVDYVSTGNAGVGRGPNYQFSLNAPTRYGLAGGGGTLTAATWYRDAFWTLDAGTPMPTIAELKTNLTVGENLANPAISQAAYGVAHWDFYRNAADQTLGLHDGTLGNFVLSGNSLTDEV